MRLVGRFVSRELWMLRFHLVGLGGGKADLQASI